MTGSGKTNQRGGDGDLEFDLDQALEEWEAEFENALAPGSKNPRLEGRDESRPRVARDVPYRPPSPNALTSRSVPPLSMEDAHPFGGATEGAATRVAAIPGAGTSDSDDKPTVPPEGPTTGTLDLEDLLGGLDDDDSPELAIEAVDEADEDLVATDDEVAATTLEAEWAPLSEPPTPSAPPLLLTPARVKRPAGAVAEQRNDARADAGAIVAKRTVHARKPREETFPLVGESHEALRARRDLLTALAERARGAHKARALVAAAELSEQLGEAREAESLYRDAVGADPRDLVALRALRRYAISNGDFAEAKKLLEVESGLALSPDDKALALLSLAEIQLRRLDDPSGAERSARTASAVSKGNSRTALLLLAEACRQQGRDHDAWTAIEKMLEAWDDPKVTSTFALLVGSAAEREGQTARAKQHFAIAAELSPDRLDAWLALARAARASGDLEGTQVALGKASELAGPMLAELLRRLRALVLLEDDRPADACAAFSGAASALGQATRAKLASAASDDRAELEALSLWAESTGGTERAWALCALAERNAAAGDLEAADAALRNAALADENLAIVRIVRERLAKTTGDTTRFGSDANLALVAAAKLAARSVDEHQERALLDAAREGSDSPIAAEVVAMDAALRAKDGDAVRSALSRRADRMAPEHRLGSILALSDLLDLSGDRSASLEVLRQAKDRIPEHPLLSGRLAVLLGSTSPREAVAALREMLPATEGEHAAALAVWASRLLPNQDEESIALLRHALELHRGYRPAAWALEPMLRAAADLDALSQLDEELAAEASEPSEAAERWMRAALLRFERDPGVAADLLERARAARPDDPIPYELLLRLGRTTSAAYRAELLEKLAAEAPSDEARATLVRAAALWEAAEEPAQSIALLRRVLESSPSDPIALRILEQSERTRGEYGPLSERRFQAVRDAQTEADRVAALEALADLDLHDRGDPASAVLSLESILETVPDHLPALRALETYFMSQRRDEDLAWIEERIAGALTEESDVAAHARLVARLRLAMPAAEGNAADALLLGLASRALLDPWFARRVEGAARARGDVALQSRALVAIAGSLPGSFERASALLVAADALSEAGENDEARAKLREAAESCPEHPVAAEELARREEEGGHYQAAAAAYEQAGHAAAVPGRAAQLFFAAGVLYDERLHDADRALSAYQKAAEREITYRDLFDRMKRLLAERDDTAALSELIRRRLAAGGHPDALVELHLARAELCDRLGDREGARDGLRAALGLEPDRLDALRKLANLCLEDEDWRGAAEALIRSARLQKDRDELRWVFFSLGHIYSRHMPDPERAVTAFRRAIRLVPDDFESMECLADLHRRLGQNDEAVEVYQQLSLRDPDAQRARTHRLKLAEVFESMGDLRRAEAELEGARRSAPTDPHVLRTVADFYRRQRADAALSMHLGRATNDFRTAIGNEPMDADAWTGIVDVLVARNRTDAARCCASAAAAVGLLDIEFARLLDARGAVPGAGVAAAEPSLEELLAPPALSVPIRRAFRLAGEVFDKIFPFDLRALAAERVPRDAPIRAEAEQVSKLLDHDLEVWVTSAAPRAFVPVSTSPGLVIVGRELLTVLEPPERTFLLYRAAKIAQAGLSVSVRTDPAHLALAIAGLIRAFDPTYTPAGIDRALLEDVAKRIQKAIPRKSREPLSALMFELAGMSGFIPGQLASAAAELGDRAALLSLGSVSAGLSALLRLGADSLPAPERSKSRAAAIRQGNETWSLLLFAISDAYFEARERTGASRIGP